MATTVPTSRQDSTSRRIRIRSGFTPRARAVSSPAARASNRGAMTSRTAVIARTVTTTASSGPDQDARPSEPSSQNITERLFSAESEAKIMKLVSAERA